MTIHPGFTGFWQSAAATTRTAARRARALLGLLAMSLLLLLPVAWQGAAAHVLPPAPPAVVPVPGLVSAQLLGEARTVRLASGAIVAIDIAQILQRGELVVAMLGVDTPPFFQMKGEQLSGIDVTLAEQMAAELKVPLRVNRSGRSFNEVVEIVARGDADLAISKLSRTLTRAQSVLFSDPYLSLNHALILNRLAFARISRDKPLPWVLRNFTGTLGVIDQSSFADFAVRNFPNAKIIAYPSWDAVIAAVKSGEVVGAYRDEFEVRRILKADPSLALTLRTVTLKDLNDTLGIAVGVRSPTLLAFVNQFLAQRNEKLTVEKVLAELK
jgi:polar amino acid transport system substrate-binding protein